MSDQPTVGAEVRRVRGEAYQVGALGKVVEVSGERLRVYWHTNPSATTKPKRTWVHRSVIVPA